MTQHRLKNTIEAWDTHPEWFYIEPLSPEKQKQWDSCIADIQEVFGPVVAEHLQRRMSTVSLSKSDTDDIFCVLTSSSQAVCDKYDAITANHAIYRELGYRFLSRRKLIDPEAHPDLYEIEKENTVDAEEVLRLIDLHREHPEQFQIEPLSSDEELDWDALISDLQDKSLGYLEDALTAWKKALFTPELYFDPVYLYVDSEKDLLLLDDVLSRHDVFRHLENSAHVSLVRLSCEESNS